MAAAADHSHTVLPRLAGERVRAGLRVSPVVVVMGARQTGKSTLVQTLHALRDHQYITLDDLDVRAQAHTAPSDLVRRAPLLIVDEVQREPDVLTALKGLVDAERPRRPGRFVLTGSTNLLLMHRVSETLAGRATYVPLWPLTRRERAGVGQAGIWAELFASPAAEWYDLLRTSEARRADWRREARIGGYPTPARELDSHDARRQWFRGYVQTYLERDLQDLAAIHNLVDFRRLMRAACVRLGGLLNSAELGRDTGIPRVTVHRYLNLLEASCQVVRVEPYAVNRTKRLIKSPKLYWSDTALALHLAGLEEPQGAHLENLILCDLLAWRDAQSEQAEVLYWRTASGLEVDFVIERGDRLLAIEIKAGARPSPSDVRHLLAFVGEYGRRVAGALLLHTGSETFWMAKSVLATPWWRLV